VTWRIWIQLQGALEVVGRSMETRNGKRIYTAMYMLICARASGRGNLRKGSRPFIVPAEMTGVQVESHEWTLNMAIDYATVRLENVRVPSSAVGGEVGSWLSVGKALYVREPCQTASSRCGSRVSVSIRAPHTCGSRISLGKWLELIRRSSGHW
jgi:hypothetical protein